MSYLSDIIQIYIYNAYKKSILAYPSFKIFKTATSNTRVLNSDGNNYLIGKVFFYRYVVCSIRRDCLVDN